MFLRASHRGKFAQTAQPDSSFIHLAFLLSWYKGECNSVGDYLACHNHDCLSSFAALICAFYPAFNWKHFTLKEYEVLKLFVSKVMTTAGTHRRESFWDDLTTDPKSFALLEIVWLLLCFLSLPVLHNWLMLELISPPLPGHWGVTSSDVLSVCPYCMAQKPQGESTLHCGGQDLSPVTAAQCWQINKK